MPATAEREKLHKLVDEIPDGELSPVVDYVSGLLCERPNAETLRAFDDAEAGRNMSGPFHDIDGLFASLLEGPDDDEI